MLTRSVVACMLSGTLVSTLFLEGPLATVVHARRMAVKKTTKATRIPTNRGTASLLSQDRRESLFPVRNTRGVANTGGHLLPFPSVRREPESAAVIHLGTFTVRAYTHYLSPGVALSKTATGTVPLSGRTVAVDPRIIPLGSKIHIEGVGERIAEDTGGKIKGKRLDLFLPSTRECRRFGVQTQEVHLLTE